MTYDQAASLVALAVSNFPHLQDKDLRPTVELWLKILGDIPYETAEAALMKVLVTCKHFPTVAEIREAAVSVSNPQVLSPAEAWASVVKAMQYYGPYRAGEAMNSLDETTKKAVRALGGFVELCNTDEIGVARAHFMKIYEQYARREVEQAILPEKVREFISGVAAKMLQEPIN